MYKVGTVFSANRVSAVGLSEALTVRRVLVQ